MQRPADLARRELAVRPRGSGERALGRHGDETVVARPESLQPLEEQLRQFGRGHAAGAEQAAQLQDRREREIARHQSAPR